MKKCVAPKTPKTLSGVHVLTPSKAALDSTLWDWWENLKLVKKKVFMHFSGPNKLHPGTQKHEQQIVVVKHTKRLQKGRLEEKKDKEKIAASAYAFPGAHKCIHNQNVWIHNEFTLFRFLGGANAFSRGHKMQWQVVAIGCKWVQCQVVASGSKSVHLISAYWFLNLYSSCLPTQINHSFPEKPMAHLQGMACGLIKQHETHGCGLISLED